MASLPTLNTTAPAVTGMAIRNEIRAAESRLKLRKRPAVMVMPEREVPGLSASTWPAPTISGVLHGVLARCRAWPACGRPIQSSEAEHDQRHGDERDACRAARRCCSSNSAPTAAAGTRRQQQQPRQAAFAASPAGARWSGLADAVADVDREVVCGSRRRRRPACRCAGPRRRPSARLLSPSKSSQPNSHGTRMQVARSRRSAGTRSAPGRCRGRWRGGWARRRRGVSRRSGGRHDAGRPGPGGDRSGGRRPTPRRRLGQER